MDQVSCMQPNDMHTQNFACVLPVDHFGHTVSFLLCKCLHTNPRESFVALQLSVQITESAEHARAQ